MNKEKYKKHFQKFVERHGLLKSPQLYLSISAGVDSIVLLDLLCSLGYSDKMELIHFNHLNRDSNSQDESLIAELSGKYGVVSRVIRLEELPRENFELRAREERYKSLRSLANENEILLGHHIDDSFEWSLMQQLKSSHLKASIGIPLRNRNFVRPLMCFTKKQILNYAKISGLAWNDDPTNDDLNYERNYVRKVLIPQIEKRYPSYLKNYVVRARSLAGKYDLLLMKQRKFRTISGEKFFEIYSLDHRGDLDSLDEELVRAVQHLSSVNRGSLRGQIEKIKLALKNNSTGPLVLVDGIRAYVQYNHVYLSKHGPKKDFVLEDKLSYSYGEFLSLIYRNKNSFFNCYLKVEGMKLPSIKRKLPFDSDSEGRVSVLNLMRYWSKEKNKTKRLRLKL